MSDGLVVPCVYTDAAHCLGDQVIMLACAKDADNRILMLGAARFNDTENKTTIGAFDKQLVRAVPRFNSAEATVVRDAQKGGICSHKKVRACP